MRRLVVDDVRAGYRSLLIRRHVAFYTSTDDEVLIQRVLHSSMDPGLHLEQDDDRTG